MTTMPLIVFDTNILMDILLGRDENSVLLVELAEKKHVELIVPEYVLLEFRGTALRWLRDELSRLQTVRTAAKEWGRSQELDKPAEEIKEAAKDLEGKLKSLRPKVDIVVNRIKSVAKIHQHSMEVHFRGDLRYLEGRPPDRPVDGIKDCRIYEAVLEIARNDQGVVRSKFLVTRDSDFDFAELTDELKSFGFIIHKKPGELFGQLRNQGPFSVPHNAPKEAPDINTSSELW